MKLGIIGAMDVEVETLKASLSDVSVSKIAGMSFYEGTLEGTPAVVVQSGVGKVNAALCVQVLVDHFGVTHVINTGVAGSLDNRINIGDLVVSTDAVFHDVDATNFGYAPGEIPGMGRLAFKANSSLRTAAVAAQKQLAPEIASFEGRIASGDQFIRDDAHKQAIAAQFGALCCEMEGAAIAQACCLNDLPFVIVRSISDKADGSQAVEYPVFEAQAAARCAVIVEYLAAHLTD